MDLCDCDDDVVIFCHVCGTSTELRTGATFLEEPPLCYCLDEPLKLICEECGVFRVSYKESWRVMEDVPECICEDEFHKSKCFDCGVIRSEDTGFWLWDTAEGKEGRYRYSCKHYNCPVSFPDGTKVYASSEHERDISEEAPDFGLYLTPMWNAASMAYYIDWEDFHLPVRWDVAANTIIDTYKKAQSGLWVEVGCMGGHGRTGTALAAMAILSGIPAKESVDWVRKNYCERAVESDTQEWWLEWFEIYVFGGTIDQHPGCEDNYPVSYKHELDWKNFDPFQPLGNGPKDSRTVVDRYAFFITPKAADVKEAELSAS
jgi:hypothetical protein